MIDIINKLEISSDLLLCDYVEQSGQVFRKELSELLEECTETEVKFVVEMAKENLKIYKKYSEKNKEIKAYVDIEH